MEEIKSLQQETLALTRRVIALENESTENKESWIDLLSRLSNLETRIIALEQARKRQIELNEEFIEDMKREKNPVKSVWSTKWVKDSWFKK